jgi:hypothetical protein
LSSAAPGAAAARPRLAVASGALYPDLHDDWPLLRAALASAGVDAATAVWSDPAVDWSSFDLVLASGTWGNIHRVDEFLAWADDVTARGVPVRNSPATLRWNIDKHYLLDLERAGVPTVPTLWVEPGMAGADVASLTLPEGEVVVKPSVSGGGYRTARYEPPEHPAARAHVAELIASERTAMVQPYEPRVDAEGETGLIYIGGTFSHAVHKGPWTAAVPVRSSTCSTTWSSPPPPRRPRSSVWPAGPWPRQRSSSGRPATPGSTWWRRCTVGRRSSSWNCSTPCCSSPITPRGR